MAHQDGSGDSKPRSESDNPKSIQPQDLDEIGRLVKRIEQVRRRLDTTVSRRSNESAPSSSELLSETVELLHATIEELRVANEMLGAKNEEIVAAHQSIAAERKRYKDLFDFAPEGYLVTTMDGTIKDANHAAAELLNAPVEYLIGKPLILFVDDDERREFRARLSRLYQIPWKLEWKQHLLPRDGPPFEGRLSVGTDNDAQGRPAGLRWQVRRDPVGSEERAEFLRSG